MFCRDTMWILILRGISFMIFEIFQLFILCAMYLACLNELKCNSSGATMIVGLLEGSILDKEIK